MSESPLPLKGFKLSNIRYKIRAVYETPEPPADPDAFEKEAMARASRVRSILDAKLGSLCTVCGIPQIFPPSYHVSQTWLIETNSAASPDLVQAVTANGYTHAFLDIESVAYKSIAGYGPQLVSNIKPN